MQHYWRNRRFFPSISSEASICVFVRLATKASISFHIFAYFAGLRLLLRRWRTGKYVHQLTDFVYIIWTNICFSLFILLLSLTDPLHSNPSGCQSNLFIFLFSSFVNFNSFLRRTQTHTNVQQLRPRFQQISLFSIVYCSRIAIIVKCCHW